MFLLASENPLDHVTDVFLKGPITMNTITLVVVAIVFVLVMMRVAKQIATGPATQGNERYITKGRLAQMVEAIIVYLRDDMLTPVMGPEATRKYLPFLMTAFFFILFQNLFGLIPVTSILELAGVHTPWIGGTATGNLMVTGALAFVAFFAIQIHGFKELGLKGWLLHCTGGLVPGPVFLYPVAALVFVVELAGHFIKPAALAIRLFANMVAGHTLMAVLLGFGTMAAHGGMGVIGWGSISLVSIIAAIAITFLELFVAFLQAFIFMFLTAVFISLLSHHEEHEEHEAAEEREHAIEEALHSGVAKPAHAHA